MRDREGEAAMELGGEERRGKRGGCGVLFKIPAPTAQFWTMLGLGPSQHYIVEQENKTLGLFVPSKSQQLIMPSPGLESITPESEILNKVSISS